MINFAYKDHYTVEDLNRIIHLLRSEQGCPWDREQSHESIRRNFLEEAYEAVEAIDENDPEHLKEELGDVLTQVIFHAAIEEECGRFHLDDVADVTCKKLIGRHPHVFGGSQVSGSEDVMRHWDDIKRREKGQKTHTSAMDSVAKSLPALWRAEKIQDKAKKAGFDWPDLSGAMDKLEEETTELRQAISQQGNIEEELGDLLFSVVNVARFLKIDPEEALGQACDKFISRFQDMEEAARTSGKTLEGMSLSEMDVLWERAKRS
ncbi:MAG: nucleoside triphosphate pyrophosphohydrolase [Oscillospiraceae bacterium]|jgi:tetrapyrrole methylase family protein/MazG family protein